MCQKCDKEITEMDIRDSDLPYLPYKIAYWYCIVPGCKGHIKVRDYGLSPYYYWPVKQRRDTDGWRGGWTELGHVYLCSHHYKLVKGRHMPVPEHDDKIRASKFILKK